MKRGVVAATRGAANSGLGVGICVMGAARCSRLCGLLSRRLAISLRYPPLVWKTCSAYLGGNHNGCFPILLRA